jgi:alanine-glyoxylate transaminase / serine-glyoxylate transaminase / serine-pyruvate transaminase
MAGRNFLFVPGPTNVPDRVLRAMVVAMEDHRSPIFPELTRACLNGLKPIFKTTTGEPDHFPSSGTGCWEAALTNCLNAGDKVLIALRPVQPSVGRHVQRLGFEVEIARNALGRRRAGRALPGLARRRQAAQDQGRAGVPKRDRHRRHQRRRRRAPAMDSVKHPALLFVDSVSALASIDFRMDEWGVDVCVSGSQKGLMLPAGLGVTCVSQKALEAAKTATSKRCYFDYADMVQANASGYFPYTPSVPMLYGLRESLAMLAEEGLENVFQRHTYLAGGVRAAVSRAGSSSCARPRPSGTPTPSRRSWCPRASTAPTSSRAPSSATTSRWAPGCPRSPASCSASAISGDLNELMLLGAIAGAEMAMLDVGVKIEPGSGVAAAQNLLAQQRAGCRRPRPRMPRKRHRGVTHRVVFLDRASLKAKVRKPAAPPNTSSIEKTAVDEIVRASRAPTSPSSTRFRCARRRSSNCRSSR